MRNPITVKPKALANADLIIAILPIKRRKAKPEGLALFCKVKERMLKDYIGN